MANATQVQAEGTVYDIKDATARQRIETVNTNLSDAITLLNTELSGEITATNKNVSVLQKITSFNALSPILPTKAKTTVISGITWTLNPDGTFTANGTTAVDEDSVLTITYGLGGVEAVRPGVNYSTVIEPANGDVKLQVIQYIGSSESVKANTNQTGTAFSIDSSATGVWVRLAIEGGKTVSNYKGSFGIIETDEANRNEMRFVGVPAKLEKFNELICRRFKNQNTDDKINFSDCPVYMDSTYLDNNGNPTNNAYNRVIYMPGAGISWIEFDPESTLDSAPAGFIIYNDGAIKIPLYLRSTYRTHLQGLFPEGLPQDAIICFNWVGGNNNPSTYFDSIIVRYAANDTRITTGKNKFNASEAYPGAQCHYSDGNFYGVDGYSAGAFAVRPGDTVRISGFGTNNAHIVFKKIDGTYINGTETDGSGSASAVAPANSAICVLSVATASLSTTIATVNDSDTSYEPFLNKFTKGISSGFLPYESGYIYHVSQTSQKPVFNGSTYENTSCLKLPSSYSESGTATPLVVICHGAGGGISSDGSSGWTYDTGYNSVVSALNNAGFAVMDSNGYRDSSAAGHEHWGCPQAVAGYVQAYDYFTNHYNLEKVVWLYGFSMGGLTALNIMISRTLPIRCAMIGVPVISLYDQCVTRQSGGVQNPYFLAAYDIEAYERSGLYGCDRYLDITTVGSTPMVFHDLPPLYIGYGLSDINISNEKIQEYYTALYNSNHIVRIHGYEGDHTVGFGGSQVLITDMVNWFKAYKQ